MRDYLKAFIVGSSWLAFVFLFIGFGNIQGEVNKNNCAERATGISTYRVYTIVAPIYLGIMSMVAIYIRDWQQISTRKAFFIIGIVSALIVSFAITFCKVYNWTTSRYLLQYVKLQLYHFIIYSIIIASLYLSLSS